MEHVSHAGMSFNREMARQFREAAQLLRAQHAGARRVEAYERGAQSLEGLDESAASIYRRDGLTGLIEIAAIGSVLASAVADVVELGRWRWLDRKRRDADPEIALAALPSVGPALARRLHVELQIESLDDLERAVYDGRLGRMRGVGDKRWHAIRDALLDRRVSRQTLCEREIGLEHAPLPTASVLLDIDAEYRRKADLNLLPTIAPVRFNPTHARWLPVLHSERDGRRFTAMFSNTARAHELNHTDDWVVILADDVDDASWTVVTEQSGPFVGERVVRGETQHAFGPDGGCLAMSAQ